MAPGFPSSSMAEPSASPGNGVEAAAPLETGVVLPRTRTTSSPPSRGELYLHSGITSRLSFFVLQIRSWTACMTSWVCTPDGSSFWFPTFTSSLQETFHEKQEWGVCGRTKWRKYTSGVHAPSLACILVRHGRRMRSTSSTVPGRRTRSTCYSYDTTSPPTETSDVHFCCVETSKRERATRRKNRTRLTLRWPGSIPRVYIAKSPHTSSTESTSSSLSNQLAHSQRAPCRLQCTMAGR